MERTMLGPSAVASRTGRRFQIRGPHAYAPSVGDGVATPGSDERSYHQSGTSYEPHCFLKRWVPLSGVHLPKLKVPSPSATARSMKDQYKSMLGAMRLYSPSAEAHVISNSLAQRNPHPPATGRPR